MDKAKGKDHSEYCWYCGKHSMFPIKGHYECTECGATWNPVITPGPPAFEGSNIYGKKSLW